jgi:hypothetical protein
MERLKSILSFAGGLAGLVMFIFGVNLLMDRWGLAFVVGVYAVMFLALLAGFLVFAPGPAAPFPADPKI